MKHFFLFLLFFSSLFFVFSSGGVVAASQNIVTNTSDYFYWNTTILNSYTGENIPVTLKLPAEYENITNNIDSRDLSINQVKSISDTISLVRSLFTSESTITQLKNNLFSSLSEPIPEVILYAPLNSVLDVTLNNVTIVNSTFSFKINSLNDSRFVQSYEIDPTDLNFSVATVEVVAKGKKLYKCSEWDYLTETCSGNWTLFLEGFLPGETYSFNITPTDPAFGEINISDAYHLDKNYHFLSNVFDQVEAQDGIWSEPINRDEYIRSIFEQNLENGNIINIYARSPTGKRAWVEVYVANSTEYLGKTGIYSSSGGIQNVQVLNISSPTNTFDLKVVSDDSTNPYLEFDHIHDAGRYLTDLSLTPSSTSIVESENVNVTGSYLMSSSGAPSGDIRLALNDTINGLSVNNVCDMGDAFKVDNIVQDLCPRCTDNNDGTITLLSPSNNEQFILTWNLSACPGSSSYSPSNLLTYETTVTNSVLDNPTGNITIYAGPQINITYPANNSVHNSKDLFFEVNTTGSIDSCIYDFNSAGNVSFNCNQRINITAVEGLNNLTVYANNTIGTWASDSLVFSVNSSIPLTFSITSPPNGTIKTDASPVLKLLAYDTDYNSINYTVDIYYANGTHYALDGNGTLTNNTETESHMDPELLLIGNLTTYIITANATDGVNNATANNVSYTLTTPAITLLTPSYNYWDNDGNISFSFKVYDEAYTNISCSLYLDGTLNQTNSSSLTGGTATNFDVSGINEGQGHSWKISCVDPSSNYGEASRLFSVDKTPPLVNTISASPTPVDAGQIINITANITDNLGIDYAQVNISGALYFMTLAGGEYSYEFNTTGLSGNYNYSVIAYDNAGNFGINNTGNFNVTAMRINLTDYYAINATGGRIDGFNSSNLEAIENLILNFSINSFVGDVDTWHLNFTANGSYACTLGNKQNLICYNYTNGDPYRWIEFRNGTETPTYDDTSLVGDAILVNKTGIGSKVNISYNIDEFYNPNVFKWYGSLMNLSDSKWQNGTAQRITGSQNIRVEVDPNIIPVHADQFKLDFKVLAVGNPSQPLEAFGCNSSYVSGTVHNSSNCVFLAEKFPSEFTGNNEYRKIFSGNVTHNLHGLKYIVIETHEQNASNYYQIQTYKAEAQNYTTHWEYSSGYGSNWTNLGDGYETELNINWFNNYSEPTAFVYNFWANTTAGAESSLEGNVTWSINPHMNYPPLVSLHKPLPGEEVGFPYLTRFTLDDPNLDELNGTMYLYNLDNTLNHTIVTGLNSSNSTYLWNDSTLDGNYTLMLKLCELNTTALYCVNVSSNISVDNSPPSVVPTSPPNGSNFGLGESIEISSNVTDNYGVSFVFVNITYPNSTVVSLNLSNFGGIKYNSSFVIPSVSGVYEVKFIAKDNAGNENSTEIVFFNVNSCVYSGSGNWNINCGDNCSISSNVNLFGGNISIIGTGNFFTSANITNFSNLFISGINSTSRCSVYCISGGCFK